MKTSQLNFLLGVTLRLQAWQYFVPTLFSFLVFVLTASDHPNTPFVLSNEQSFKDDHDVDQNERNDQPSKEERHRELQTAALKIARVEIVDAERAKQQRENHECPAALRIDRRRRCARRDHLFGLHDDLYGRIGLLFSRWHRRSLQHFAAEAALLRHRLDRLPAEGARLGAYVISHWCFSHFSRMFRVGMPSDKESSCAVY